MTNQGDLETRSQWGTKRWTYWGGQRVRDTEGEGDRQKERRFVRKSLTRKEYESREEKRERQDEWEKWEV